MILTGRFVRGSELGYWAGLASHRTAAGGEWDTEKVGSFLRKPGQLETDEMDVRVERAGDGGLGGTPFCLRGGQVTGWRFWFFH